MTLSKNNKSYYYTKVQNFFVFILKVLRFILRIQLTQILQIIYNFLDVTKLLKTKLYFSQLKMHIILVTAIFNHMKKFFNMEIKLIFSYT